MLDILGITGPIYLAIAALLVTTIASFFTLSALLWGSMALIGCRQNGMQAAASKSRP